ncbi:MAG: tRNA pseudouridine(38-40) synthase TruA [Acidimicrobiales bacterium]|nr:MAG: tRNA pseudouridine(38-40) synthase TruA [Acidimicrobiales bacterium]
MVLAYRGDGFHGFAAQPGQRTVAGELAGAIAKVLGGPQVGGQEVRLVCAGRTDTGVHAWGQVVHADLNPPVDPAALARSCTKMLAPAIVVRSAEVAPPGFDARHSALARRYRYTIHNTAVPDPFLAGLAWHVEEPLDLRAMRNATDSFLGRHDFSALCRRPPDRPEGPITRRVLDARWIREGQILRLEVEAESFCHQMVRSMVGLLVRVGRGRARAGDMSWILASGDRGLAGSPAPPCGLCLWEVRYADPLGGFAPPRTPPKSQAKSEA